MRWMMNFAVALTAAFLSFVYHDAVLNHPLYLEYVSPVYERHLAGVVDTFLVKYVAQSNQSATASVNLLEPIPLDIPIDVDDCKQRAVGHLTDVMPVVGFHVLCIDKQSHKVIGAIFKQGLSTLEPIPFISALDMGSLRNEIEQKSSMELPEGKIAKKYKQAWAFYSPDGIRLTKLSDLNNKPLVYVFEGGQFIWPGIHVGYERVVKNLHGLGDVTMKTLAMTPLVFSVEEFLLDDEIDVVLDLSMEHLAPSGVTYHDGDEGKPATEWRTSTTYFLSSSRHEVVRGIDQRVEDLVKVAKSHQEDVQVLRYEETQKYDHHTDYFPVESHKNNPALVERLHHGYKNRMITVFWYMSDVAKGGHTIFPRAGGTQEPSSMKDCTVGLKVAPKKRKVIIFYSMLANGQGDKMSLHGGCPVEEGMKFSGNKWIWNKPRNES